MSRDECTQKGIVKALAAAAKKAQVIDLVLMVHGEPDNLILAGETTETIDVSAAALAHDLLATPALKGKLRLCYSTACFGYSHAQALLGAGFTTVIGAKGVNANSATEMPTLLKHWTGGETIADALRRADDPVLRMISDAVARRNFSDVNSQKELLGSESLTIDSPARS